MKRSLQARGPRWRYVVAAVLVVAAALLSPLNTLADGVLFSAHMAQHLLLLLIAPALALLALPRCRERERVDGPQSSAGHSLTLVATMAWTAGVGSMWLWHVPALCDAAVNQPTIRAVQIVSLLLAGGAFWWPILAPKLRDRLMPGYAVLYLFTACLACTALGIILTLTPIEVCPVFRAPASGPWAALRARIGVVRDQQIGGLLMWVPMCLVYLGAILVELTRWLGGHRRDVSPTATAEVGQ